jgi:cell division initiation protein
MITDPRDIRRRKFKMRMRGFDPQDVDSFLVEIAAAFQSLQGENQRIAKRMEGIEAENKRYKQREDSIQHAMVNSQKALDQMKANARKSADLTVSQAEMRAQKILDRAHNRLSQLHEDIAALKRQRMQIEVQIRSIIESHGKLLDMRNEEMRLSDAENDKVLILKQSP